MLNVGSLSNVLLTQYGSTCTCEDTLKIFPLAWRSVSLYSVAFHFLLRDMILLYPYVHYMATTILHYIVVHCVALHYITLHSVTDYIHCAHTIYSCHTIVSYTSRAFKCMTSTETSWLIVDALRMDRGSKPQQPMWSRFSCLGCWLHGFGVQHGKPWKA